MIIHTARFGTVQEIKHYYQYVFKLSGSYAIRRTGSARSLAETVKQQIKKVGLMNGACRSPPQCGGAIEFSFATRI